MRDHGAGRGVRTVARRVRGSHHRDHGGAKRVGEVYRTGGMVFALATAKFWSAFDVIAIDGVVDGLAYGVRHVGDKVRHTQTGKLQHYAAVAVLAFFAVLALVISY